MAALDQLSTEFDRAALDAAFVEFGQDLHDTHHETSVHESMVR